MGKKTKTHKEERGDKKKKGVKARPKTMEEFSQTFSRKANEIKKKQKRVEVNYKRNSLKNQIKMK